MHIKKLMLCKIFNEIHPRDLGLVAKEDRGPRRKSESNLKSSASIRKLSGSKATGD
jgi:hypothetical protein